MPHPSLQEILQCCESLSREMEPLALRGPPPRVLPLHPGHGPAVQAAYEDIDLGARKVVVTHWLADFSFSLPSIRHVIDSGLELRSVSERDGGDKWAKDRSGPLLICLGLDWGAVTGVQSSDPSRIPSVETNQQVSGRGKKTTGKRNPTR